MDGPSPGTVTGLTEIATGVREILSPWKDLHDVIDEYRELDDERVLVLLRADLRGKTSGVGLDASWTRGAEIVHTKQGRVTSFARAKAANEQQRIEGPIKSVVGCFCNKRQHASLALDLYISAVGYDFNAVDGFARQSIGRAKNLNWTYQIKFVDRRHREDDHAPTRWRVLLPRIAVLSGHDGSS